MLFLILIVGTQPTVSMHYCGKILQSVNLLNKQEVPACCSMNHNQRVSDDRQVTIYPTSCCSTQEVKLSTDDYQYQQTLKHIAVFSIDLIWSVVPLQIQSQSLIFSVKLRKDYPPEGLANLNRDILTSISILII